jgi:hypothetical protein
MTQSPKPKSFPLLDLSAYSTDSESTEPEDDAQGTRKANAYSSRHPKVGESFIPWKRFHVLPMPDSLLSSELPAGAKLIYGRLCRHAGKKDFAWPTPATLGAEVGFGERQTQKHLRTLERKGFIRREEQFRGGAQTNNRYVFLWNQFLEDNWENDHPREG